MTDTTNSLEIIVKDCVRSLGTVCATKIYLHYRYYMDAIVVEVDCFKMVDKSLSNDKIKSAIQVYMNKIAINNSSLWTKEPLIVNIKRQEPDGLNKSIVQIKIKCHVSGPNSKPNYPSYNEYMEAIEQEIKRESIA